MRLENKSLVNCLCTLLTGCDCSGGYEDYSRCFRWTQLGAGCVRIVQVRGQRRRGCRHRARELTTRGLDGHGDVGLLQESAHRRLGLGDLKSICISI